MRYKLAIRVALLAFVAASLAWIGIREMRERRRPTEVVSVASAMSEPVTSSASGEDGLAQNAAPQAEGPKLVAYYFHTTYRCYTCRLIEAYAEEALKRGFPGALKAGMLEWRPVNVQLLENRHFIQDYQLFTKSVVIAKFKGGRQVDWKNLEKVWELVGNKNAFLSYIQSEVRQFLEKG